jgi:hypothetical protein
MAAFVEKHVRVLTALALLLFTLGCAKAAIEQKAFKEIKAKGGSVELRGKGPAITFSDVQITDQDLACITPLEKVQSVTLMFVPITDEGLEHLLRLEKLTAFTYRKTGITPAGIDKLKKKFPEIVITEK